MKNKMVGAIISGVLVLGVGVGVVMCSEITPAGYVKVQFSMNGGVKEDVLTQGWSLVSPFIKTSKYSVATEQLFMSADEKEGSKENDSITITTKDGALNADFEMSYAFDAERVPQLYERYRGMEGRDIIDNIVRGKIKTFVSEVTSQYTVLEVHLEKKSEVNNDILKKLQEELLDYGIIVQSANLTATRPDESVRKAIEERSKVAQEVEKAKLEKDKAIIEGETLKVKAENERIANQEQAKGLTREILIMEAIEKWNGVLPTVTGTDGVNAIINNQTTPKE